MFRVAKGFWGGGFGGGGLIPFMWMFHSCGCFVPFMWMFRSCGCFVHVDLEELLKAVSGHRKRLSAFDFVGKA